MGLTSWRGNLVCKGDVSVAKNYLNEQEIVELNRIVVMWLDFAEDQAKRRKQVFLQDWERKLDEFLRFNDREVLPDGGRLSRKEANELAERAYEQFAARRRALLEEEGAHDMMRALEKIADHRPNGQASSGKPGRPRRNGQS
ncbi:MAG: virulence RhuM family protein [Magnetococcus sp. YQC-3]